MPCSLVSLRLDVWYMIDPLKEFKRIIQSSIFSSPSYQTHLRSGRLSFMYRGMDLIRRLAIHGRLSFMYGGMDRIRRLATRG